MKCRTALGYLALTLALGAPNVSARADEVREASTYAAPDPAEDPRRAVTSEGEQTVRKLNDVVFWRPFYFVQLVAGVAALPVALPVAWAVADWEDAIDMCVTGPYAMAFERPLGE